MIDEEEAIRVAREGIQGVAEPQQDAPIQVELDNGRYVVEFVHVNAPGVRGPDYAAKVTLDAETGEVLEILVGS